MLQTTPGPETIGPMYIPRLTTLLNKMYLKNSMHFKNYTSWHVTFQAQSVSAKSWQDILKPFPIPVPYSFPYKHAIRV